VVGMRKPGFEIYQVCAKEMGVELAECVSVADNIKRDIPGAKKAGVGCNIIFNSPEKKHAVEFTEETRPDAVIDDFTEILNLLPDLK
ncbi:MAG: HAD hydrolase-like protein, partial [Oscillibacter sp.]|nr:HAD hydrolase-like protein [Oscillibacter sp.]